MFRRRRQQAVTVAGALGGRKEQTRPGRPARFPAPHRRLGIRHRLSAVVAPAGGASGTTRCRRPGWPGHAFAASAAFYRHSASGIRPRTAQPAGRARVSSGSVTRQTPARRHPYRRTRVAQPVRGRDREVGVEALGVLAPPRRGLRPGVRLPDRVLFRPGLRPGVSRKSARNTVREAECAKHCAGRRAPGRGWRSPQTHAGTGASGAQTRGSASPCPSGPPLPYRHQSTPGISNRLLVSSASGSTGAWHAHQPCSRSPWPGASMTAT